MRHRRKIFYIIEFLAYSRIQELKVYWEEISIPVERGLGTASWWLSLSKTVFLCGGEVWVAVIRGAGVGFSVGSFYVC